MTALNGALVLIEAGDGGSPEAFTTIGGLRTSDMLLSNHVLDTTNVESGAWKEILGNAGIASLSISGSGMFTNSSSEETFRGYAFAASINNYKFVFANGSYVSGPFIISSYHRSGQYDSEESYTLALESAGPLTFTS